MSYSEETSLHELKNVLQRVARKLNAAMANPETREEVLGNLRGEVEKSVARARERLALQPVRFDLGQQIRDVAGWYLAELAESGIEVRYTLDPVPEVEMIREGFSDALGNLLANAIRAIQSYRNSGGKIEVGCAKVESEGVSCIDVTVKDNGNGVAEDQSARVFEPGFTTYPDAGGTGWGLFLAKQVMDRYNGRILFQSGLGEGTRVTLRFPARRILASFP